MRPQPGTWVISSSRAREAHEHLAEATAAHAAEAERIERAEAQRDAATAQAGAGLERIRADSAWQREELRQILDGRASVLQEARAESASAEVERVRQDAGRALGELRASTPREREEAAARLAAALQAAQAAATRLDEERTTHAAEAGRIEREELRQVPGGRASVLEEARAELRARAGRAGRELDPVRAGLAEPGRA